MQFDIKTGTPKFSRKEAMSFTAKLDFANAAKWRLPTRDEFKLLLDQNSSSDVKLPTAHPFQNVTSGQYWSSSNEDIYNAWSALIGLGNVFLDDKTVLCYAWPVRSAPATQVSGDSGGRFVDLGDRTVYDQETKLIMLKNLADVKKIIEMRELGISPSEIHELICSIERQSGPQKRV